MILYIKKNDFGEQKEHLLRSVSGSDANGQWTDYLAWGWKQVPRAAEESLNRVLSEPRFKSFSMPLSAVMNERISNL